MKQHNQTDSPQETTEVTFAKKSTEDQRPKLTESETHFLELFHQLQKSFNEQEIYEVIVILDLLSQNKLHVKTVLQLLEDKAPTA